MESQTGYADDQIAYALDNCGVDWNAQAIQVVLDLEGEEPWDYPSAAVVRENMTAFYDDDRLDYAFVNCGIDWNEQAVMHLELIITGYSMTRQEAYDTLVMDRFTPEQAEYACNALAGSLLAD